jgi:glycosyltransferase involved in cell wall biosynthesis
MRILYVSQYFPPEMGAPAARVYELAREWVRRGDQVTVLTAFPNHPTGVIPVQYRAALRCGSMRESVDGIEVVRTWLYAAPNRSPRQRILNYTSFFLSAVARGLWLQRPDVVIGTSPQLLAGLAGWLLARRFLRPFVFEVRDLWPESLPASGISRPGSALYRVLAGLACFLYRRADLVVPVTEAFCPAIGSAAPGARLAVIENGFDSALFRPLDPRDAKRILGLGEQFVVSYIGTIGFAHGLDVVLRTAIALRRTTPNVLFLFVGEGAERESLQAKARDLGLENVRFVGERPRLEMPHYIAASDACLVLLRNSELFRTVLPSKMLEFMACSRPVIAGVAGYTASLVRDSEGGICITPEDDRALGEAIRRLYEEPSLGGKLGGNGRRFVLKRFTREEKAKAYVRALEDLTHAMSPE